MEVLKVLGFLTAATAGVRVNSFLGFPNSGQILRQPVFNSDGFDTPSIYPHAVYVGTGSGPVVRRINEKKTATYGRKVYESSNAAPRRPINRQVANEQFLKEVTPTTQSLREKQDDKLTAVFAPAVNVYDENRDEYSTDAQEEQSVNSQDHLRPQYKFPNSDFRVLYVQGNNLGQEDENSNNNIVFIRPKPIQNINQSTREGDLKKRPYNYEAINKENSRALLTNENFAHVADVVEQTELDNNKQVESGLGNFRTDQHYSTYHTPHYLQKQPEQEQLPIPDRQKTNQPKYGERKTNSQESKAAKYRIPVIHRTRNEENLAVTGSQPHFLYILPYSQYPVSVQTIQDEEE